MNFYELLRPIYDTDFVFFKKNPAKMVNRYFVPGFACPFCGPIGLFGRLNVNVDEKFLINNFKKIKHLPYNEWFEMRVMWAQLLEVQVDTIRPGDRLGAPIGRLGSEKYLDFIFVFPGIVWITEKVHAALLNRGINGARFDKVNMEYRGREYAVTKFYEIYVESIELYKGEPQEEDILCTLCKRRDVTLPETLIVDLSRWSGSDIFRVNCYPYRIFVTERVKAIFEEYQFTNYRLIPVESA